MHRTFLLLLLLLLPAPASAQEVSDEYRQVAEQGQEAFNQGNFPEARRLWQQARSILPNPRIYRLLGRVAAEMNDHIEAVRMYRLALTAPENGNPLTEARRTEVEQVLLPQSLAHVGEILLEVEPADASITVNGSPADVQNGSLLLPIGSYTLRVRRSGYQDHEQRIELHARARESVAVVLTRDGESPAPPVGASRASSGPDLVGPLVLFGVAGAGLVTFAVAGGLALAEEDTLATSCGVPASDPPTCAPDRLAQLETLTAVADVGWIVAAAAAAAGIVWLAVALSSGTSARESALRVAPWASAGAGGVVLSGRMEGL